MCLNALPTKANLLKKKIVFDFLYLICGMVEETMEHILWNYPVARDAWSVCCQKLQKCGEMYDEFILFVDIRKKIG